MSDKQAAIDLKIMKAKALLSEVDALIKLTFYATAVNRLYYACFHATKALLLSKDIIPKTHSGVVTMLHLHFVQTGEFESKYAAFFSKLMQQRIEEDYGDFLIVKESEVVEFIEPAKAYVAYIEKILKK